MGKKDVFDSKIFNAEVFQGYVDRVPNLQRNQLLKSRAIRPRADLRGALADGTGGNYITTTLRGLISGAVHANYDGNTDIPVGSTTTFRHSRVVVGRMNGWTETDFSYDITGGEDFMENIASQVAEYWAEVDQETILHILKGVFNMKDTQGAKFVASHTSDLTTVANSQGDVGLLDSTSFNTAMQKACGDNKSAFSLAIMHSMVATNLENLKVLVYMKYNDADGMERDVSLGTINGRLVLIDDSMPVDIVPAASDGSIPARTLYTTYLLGNGAIEYTNCGARVPYEMDRDPRSKGGQNMLYSRQRKCWAPYGISFTQASMATLSPTDEELENGANWEIVHSEDGQRQYLDLRSIPIARIISLG